MKNVSDVNNIITPNYADCVLKMCASHHRKTKQTNERTNEQCKYRRRKEQDERTQNTSNFEWSLSIEFIVLIAHQMQLFAAENMIEHSDYTVVLEITFAETKQY